MATGLAAFGLLVWLAGFLYLAAVMRRNAGAVSPLALWMLLPLALIVFAAIASYGDRVGPMWMPIGALWGFSVAGMWSVGLFCVLPAFVLTAAGLAHFVAVRSWWNALVAPLWWLAGVTSIGVMFLVVDVVRERAGGGFTIVTHAPAIVVAGWLFVGVAAAIGGCYAGRLIWRARTRHPALAVIGLVLDLAVVLACGWYVIRRGAAVIGPGHGESCWTENGVSKCEPY